MRNFINVKYNSQRGLYQELGASGSSIDFSGAFLSVGVLLSDVEIKTTSFTAGNSSIYLCDSSANHITASLPNSTAANKQIFTFKKINSGSNKVILQPVNSQTIDGNDEILINQWTTVTVVSFNSAWYII